MLCLEWQREQGPRKISWRASGRNLSSLIEDKGASVEDTAARFGVPPSVVKQRLKLANVSPKLRALLRKGAMDLEHVMAFAISDDHAAQERVWAELPDWNRDPGRADAGQHPMTDRLARFVGLDTYLAAGGTVTRDPVRRRMRRLPVGPYPRHAACGGEARAAGRGS